MANIAVLNAWLNQAIDELPTDQAQIILNIDGNNVVVETKVIEEERATEGRWRRTETRKFDRLRIGRHKRVMAALHRT